MLKTITKLSLCVILSGCVIYAPTYVTEDHITVVHNKHSSSLVSANEKIKTAEGPVRAEIKSPQVSIKRSLADCDAFTLPRDVRKPKYLTPEDLISAKDAQELDLLLGTKVKELQTYIDKVHIRIEQAHQKWLDACEAKLQ